MPSTRSWTSEPGHSVVTVSVKKWPKCWIQ